MIMIRLQSYFGVTYIICTGKKHLRTIRTMESYLKVCSLWSHTLMYAPCGVIPSSASSAFYCCIIAHWRSGQEELVRS